MQQVKVTLPKLGESVAEATITAWLKKPGERIEKDETLCEIGTDKVESELPSEFSGTIQELLFAEGDVVQVGQAIAIVLTEDQATIAVDDFVENSISEEELKHHPSRANTLEKNSAIGFLTPVVRQMIAENDLEIDELKQIKASGINARITKKDLTRYLAKKNQPTKTQTVHQKLDLPIEADDEVKPMSRMRLLLAEHLQKASQQIPHVTTFIEVNVSKLVQKREGQKEQFLQAHQTKLTFTHFLQYAVIQSLQAFPQLNSWFNKDEWIWKKGINLGFAAALPNGNLIVPNVKAAQKLDFVDFVLSINNKAAQAKTGKLAPDDLEQTTFTVSNTGMFGSQMGTPIVSLPQVAVLAFGQILRKPIVQRIGQQEQIIPADVMMFSLSYDHRVVDGALASQFLSDLKSRVEAI